MRIENDIFKSKIFDEDKGKAFGFVKTKTGWMYSSQMLEGAFRADIQILDGEVMGQVMDLSTGDEYVNFRMENNPGKFAGSVREEYKNLLTNIADNCFYAKEWIIPANPHFYDIIGHFEKKDTVDWHQRSSVKRGDIVYMYIGAPYSAIMYKCEAIKVDLPCDAYDKETQKTDKENKLKIMMLKLVERYQPSEFPLKEMKKYGVTGVRGARSMPKALSQKINHR